MRIHVKTMFGCDVSGRLRYVREPWGDPHAPPRFFMGRTARGNVWNFRYDLPDELVRKLDVLCRSEPVTEDLMRPPRVTVPVKAALQGHSPIVKEERGPAYLIPESVRTPKDAVLVTKENRDILQDGFPWMLRHIQADIDVGPVAAGVAEGRAVSICFSARLTSSAAEAGVETREAMRRRGYATKAVAGWAIAIYKRGLLPLYSTSWDNLPSMRVAHKLGMAFYGEDWLIE
jgi:GNAT acetyltransferase